jgi:O-antigen/teichoic acid export membrane protein
LALANVGTPQALVRRLIKYESEGETANTGGLVSTLFFAYAGLILLFGVIIWAVLRQDLFGAVGLISQDNDASRLLRQAALPLFLVFAFDLWRTLFDSMIVARNKIYLAKLLLAALLLVRGICLYLVLRTGGSLIDLLLAYALAAALFCALFYVVGVREQRVKISPANFRMAYLRDILPDSFWYLIGGVAVVLIFQTDSLVISSFVGVAAITSYALMFRYVGMVGRMLTNIVLILFPEAAKRFEAADYGGLLGLHDRLTRLMLAIAVVVFGAFYLVGDTVFAIWMGSLELFDRELFVIFLLTNALLLISAPATNLLEAVGWHRFSTKLSLGQGVLNLLLSIILVQRLGVVGVALATLIALACTNFLGDIFYFRRRMRLTARRS